MRWRKLATLLALTSFVAASAQPELEPVSVSPPELPVDRYAELAAAGAQVYRVRSAESVVLARVSPAGVMKRLGHDHIVASEDVAGYVAVDSDLSGSRADLQLPLRMLIVDKPSYRKRYGLEEEVAADAVAGTYVNMQSVVLKSDRYPYAQISAMYLDGSETNPSLDVEIRLHGHSAKYRVPVSLSQDANKLSVTGSLTVQHADFGLKVFTAAAGLLRVAEPIELYFSITADRYDFGS